MAEARVERRLAAVLAADVAGYRCLMGADEEGTLAALKAYRRELVEFASAVDAVRCAMEIQRAMGELSVAVPEDRRIELRIGILRGNAAIDRIRG